MSLWPPASAPRRRCARLGRASTAVRTPRSFDACTSASPSWRPVRHTRSSTSMTPRSLGCCSSPPRTGIWNPFERGLSRALATVGQREEENEVGLFRGTRAQLRGALAPRGRRIGRSAGPAAHGARVGAVRTSLLRRSHVRSEGSRSSAPADGRHDGRLSRSAEDVRSVSSAC